MITMFILEPERDHVPVKPPLSRVRFWVWETIVPANWRGDADDAVPFILKIPDIGPNSVLAVRFIVPLNVPGGFSTTLSARDVTSRGPLSSGNSQLDSVIVTLPAPPY